MRHGGYEPHEVGNRETRPKVITKRVGKPRMTLTGTEQLVQDRRAQILRIAEQHGAHNVRVFGSVARGDARPDSDVDLLVDAGPVTSSWFPAGLVLDLEELLGRRVEVVTEKALRAEIRDYVLREAVPL